MRAIKSVKCPYCKDIYLEKKKIRDTLDYVEVWDCPKCVFRYREEWFNEFNHFEELVIRE